MPWVKHSLQLNALVSSDSSVRGCLSTTQGFSSASLLQSSVLQLFLATGKGGKD